MDFHTQQQPLLSHFAYKIYHDRGLNFVMRESRHAKSLLIIYQVFDHKTDNNEASNSFCNNSISSLPFKDQSLFYSVEIYCIDVPEMMLTQILSLSDIHFTNLPYEYKFSCMQFNIYIFFWLQFGIKQKKNKKKIGMKKKFYPQIRMNMY